MSSTSRREEMLRKKAEDEARKAGTLPPEKDKHGQIINPHIPEFMSKVPWYVQQAGEESGAGLDHQRLPENKKDHSDIGLGWYERAAPAKLPQQQKGGGESSTRQFVRGACENCGAMTHNAKNCLERPRKLGASRLGTRLAADDYKLPEIQLGYAGKRDQYNGFAPETQLAQIQQRKLLNLQQEVAAAKQSSSGSAAAALPSNSLRVRTDTAKYLRNLDPESAFYDPKTRSMRANPTPHLSAGEVSFAGDNFIKNSGEVAEFEQVEEFAQGNLMSNPTAIALQRKRFLELVKSGEEEARMKRKALKSEYTGGDGSAMAASLPSSSTCYFEYTPDGRVRNDGELDFVPSSKYEEDVLEGNHAQIWGSYFDADSMHWGYACCFQTIRKSYCIGERGKEAARTAKMQLALAKEGKLVPMPPAVATAKDASAAMKSAKKHARTDRDDAASSSSSSDSSSDWNSSSDEEEDAKTHHRSKQEKKSKKKSHKKKKSRKESKREQRREKRDKSAAMAAASAPQFHQQQFGDTDAHRANRMRAGDPMGNLM